MSRKAIELGRVTHRTLELCGVTRKESVIVYSDTSKDPDLVDAFFAAATAIASEATLVLRPPRPMLTEPPNAIRDLLSGADLVVDMATHPWLYTYALNAILDSGARVLQVNASKAAVGKLTPSEWKIRRAEAGASLFTAANEIEITSAGGTHLRMRCDGRAGWGQDGVVVRPGDWDGAATNILAVAPLEDSLEGILVIDMGDTIAARPHRARTQEPLKLRIEAGRITAIEGQLEAQRLTNWFAAWQDPNAYVVAHTGFGGDPRAGTEDPSDWESIEGGINLAFGSNLFRGLGGANHARSHMDIVLLQHTMKLNGETVVADGRLIEPSLVTGQAAVHD